MIEPAEVPIMCHITDQTGPTLQILSSIVQTPSTVTQQGIMYIDYAILANKLAHKCVHNVSGVWKDI